MPFALVQGEQLSTLPDDLYIPPDALEVILEAFEGPLDLLLYLIRRQNLDIRDIPMAEITAQYMAYVALMQELKLDLAAEYLLMAAMLAEIKSRLLLPRQETVEGEEGNDPRSELVRRLLEYEQFRRAASDLDSLPRLERDFFVATTVAAFEAAPMPLPSVPLGDLLRAFQAVLQRSDHFTSHQISREPLSIRERMTRVLAALQQHQQLAFADLFVIGEGRSGVVVTLMAVLELLKAHLIDVVQAMPDGLDTPAYAPLYIRSLERVT
ncbi:MAG: segregation/condensation protein A [Proteobacteria bacterium]|nr:MAG: segregation/condensation protein A [Pseudomonadota bacterium]